MGGRKQKNREPKAGIHIIGEGMTEQYYFAHLKQLRKFRYMVKPRFFDNTSISNMEKRIEELLCADVFVICVFDADVSLRNESERKRLEKLRIKYCNNKNVLLCDSLPSIEYWFLLHFENKTRFINDAKTAKKEMKNYIKGYESTRLFLEKDGWVKQLCADGKLEQAIKRASDNKDKNGSYSTLYKLFEMLENEGK